MRWGMVIDLDKCTACQACTVACRAENNVPFAGEEQTKKGRAIFWMEVIAFVEGKYPQAKARFIPRPCMHCENPPCVQVCPVAATYKDESGRVLQRYERCIGCRYCMVACPYDARYFNWYAPQYNDVHKNYLNPDVPIRPKGVVEKCTFCVQRTKEAEEKAKREGRRIRDGDVQTACQQTCTGGAIYFGDLEDPESMVSKLSRSRRAMRLLEEIGTHPQVYYLTEG